MMLAARVLAVLSFVAVVPPAAFQTDQQSAAACSCVQRTTEQLVSDSELVFVGTIQSVVAENPVFAVEEYLKGSAGSPLTISDPTGDSAACSYFPADASGKYLMFADASGAEYTTSLCSGNASFADPGTEALVAEVDALTEPGALPESGGITPQEESEDEQTEDLPWVPVLVLAFAIPAAVLATAFIGKGGSGGH
jgi:hypothetical protein